MTPDEIALLAQIPSQWSEVQSLDLCDFENPIPLIEELIEQGFLLAESGSAWTQSIVRRHESFEENCWPREAMFFHSTIAEGEKALSLHSESLNFKEKLATATADAESFIERNGPPPSIDYCPEPQDCIELDLESREEHLFKVLEARSTTRSFIKDHPVSMRQCSSLLRYTFGAFGSYEISPSFSLFHKTSPSGGGLHPIEAFLIAIDVEALASGIYHYNPRRHNLNIVNKIPRSELRALVTRMAQCQTFAGGSSLAVVLAARWKRNFWKYRDRPSTYNVIMTDAGHLSQTFYLVATALGLGAFYTAALDHRLVLQQLELEDEAFGALGICGCGIPDLRAPDLLLRRF